MAKYSPKSQATVKSAMDRMKKGTLTSGNSNKKVTNPKQAIAIGLSEARAKGAKVPAQKTSNASTKKKSVTKTAAKKKSVAKKSSAKKSSAKKSVTKKTSIKKSV
jgi:hypothetical protein